MRIERLKSLERYVLLILLIITCMGGLQFTYSGLQQDDWFHIRYAVMLRQNGFSREFPWLKHTILNEKFSDGELLYHLILIPFTFGDLIRGGKIAAVVLLTAVTVLCYWFLNQRNSKHPLFFTLLFLFGSSSFLIRTLAVHNVSLGIGFFILGTYLLINKKYIWIALLSYLLVLASSLFPLFVGVVCIYTIYHTVHYRQLETKPVLSCVGGTAAGLVLNPYFPHSIGTLFSRYGGILFAPGRETSTALLPLNSWALFLTVWSIFILLFATVLLMLYKRETISFDSTFLFILCVLFLVLNFKMARGVELFVPFTVLFCAFTVTDLDIRISTVAKVAMAGFVAAAVVVNSYVAFDSFKKLDEADYSGSALWLRENTPEGSEVFVSDYRVFPQLFFYNQHNVYTFGLDPQLMCSYDERLYNLYYDAIQLQKDPYPIIRNEFDARYVHIENVAASRGLYQYLRQTPHLYRTVYQDDFSAVFELR